MITIQHIVESLSGDLSLMVHYKYSVTDTTIVFHVKLRFGELLLVRAI